MQKRIWHKSYAPGVPTSLDYEKITISQALTRSAEKFPDTTAINYMGNKITYRQLNDMVNQFSKALKDLGVKKGDSVAVCLPNLPQTIIANLAAFRIGAVAAQNNPLYTERELAYQLNDSDAKVLVTMALLIPRIENIQSETKIEKIVACHINSYLPFPIRQLFPLVKKGMHRKIDETENLYVFKNLIKKYSTEPVKDEGKWDELGALIYTGGTTGVSKGVMLSHRNISSNVQQFVAWFPDLNPGEERLIGTFPVFHSAGFTAVQNFFIWMAFEHLMIPRPEPASIIDIIKKWKPTFLPGAPTIFVGLLNSPEFRKLDFSGLKGFFSGSAPLAADTIRDLHELTGAFICEVYGLTETTPIATVTPWGGTIKPGTVGIPVPDTDVKLVDPETGKDVKEIGGVGEICIKGPQVMMGYYKKPKETKEVMKGQWFMTGDMGTFDEDGYLSIVDRKKDMIIAGGYNIYPVEVDGVLYDNPKILEACTVGVPDEYRGETVKAFVVLKEGEVATEEEIITYCRQSLAAYKIPRIVEFMDDIPKSAVGKILRRKLRDMEVERMQKEKK